MAASGMGHDIPNLEDVPMSRYEEVDKWTFATILDQITHNHPATQYPLPWMVNRPRSFSVISLILAVLSFMLVSLSIWRLATIDHGYQCSNPHQPPDFFASTLALTVASALSCGATIAWIAPAESIFKTVFGGMGLLHLGATFGLVAAAAGFRNDIEAGYLRVMSSWLLVVGATVFFSTSLIIGPPMVMLASLALVLGTGAWQCEAITRTWYMGGGGCPIDQTCGVPDDVPDVISAVACGCLLIAMLLMGRKAFTNMRKPWLGLPNYTMYGVTLFTGSVALSLAITARRFSEDDLVDDDIEGLDRLRSALLWFGTAILVLQSSRVKDNLESVLENRYPSTVRILTQRRDFSIAWIACWIGILGALAAAGVLLMESPNRRKELNIAAAVSHGTISISFLMLSIAFFRRSYKGNILLVFGVVVLAITFGIDAEIYLLHEDVNSEFKAYEVTTLSVVTHAAGGIGALSMLLAGHRMSIAPVKLIFLSSWSNIFHPGNYILLGGFLFLVGEVLRITGAASNLARDLHHEQQHGHDFDSLGSIATVSGFIVALFHLSMANHAWAAMNSTSTDEKMDASSETTVPVMAPQPSNEGESHNQKYDVDVLIVGCGPAGLLLASILGKNGLSVVAVEKREHPVTDSRFQFINCATMEHLDDQLDPKFVDELKLRGQPPSQAFGSILSTGLAHDDAEILKTACTPPGQTLAEYPHLVDRATEARCIKSRYSPVVPVRAMQGIQEHVLLKQARAIPSVTVLYGHEFNSYVEESRSIAGVSEVVRSKVTPLVGENSEPFEVVSKYIVGADGPSSKVSDIMKVRFDGFIGLAQVGGLLVKAPGLFEKVTAKIGSTHQYQVIRKNFGMAGVVPTDPARDLWNMPIILGPVAQDALKSNTDKVVAEFLGTDDFQVVYSGKWHWNFFVARQFRSGRAFLVGDAAHSWPPFAGMGGNTAYGDCVNLGWKLAAACKGWGSQQLLDSYDRERRHQVLQTAMYVLGATPRPGIVNKLNAPIMQKPVFRQWLSALWYMRNAGVHNANHFSQSGVQIGIKFNHSGVIVTDPDYPPDDPSCDYRPSVTGGSRIPYCPLELTEDSGDPSARMTSTVSELSRSGYTLLVPRDAPVQHVRTAVYHLINAFDIRLVSVKLVVGRIDRARVRGAALREVAKLYDDVAYMLIRPDRIIAWCQIDSANLTPPISSQVAESVVSTVTGLTREGTETASSYHESDGAKNELHYLEWLRKQFLFNIRPYKFRFPRAIKVSNETKAEAIARARTAKNNQEKPFSVVTSLAHNAKAVNHKIESI